MINQEKILRLFKRFAGDTIDLHGLKCIPVRVGEEIISKRHNKPYYPIEFKIKNPNDVSYFYSIVDDDLLDIVTEFEEYVGLRLTTKVLWDEQPKFYLNDKTRDQIQKVFDSVREIKFTTGTPFVGYRRYVINIESVGLKNKHFDDDSYSIDNTVVPLSATKNGENVDVNEAINEYIDEFLPHVETYYETEEYYRGVDQVISQYPLLNVDYVATYYDTKFIR
jgi:hypothetical protein